MHIMTLIGTWKRVNMSSHMTRLEAIIRRMDYRRPIKPFSKNIPNFWTNWADWPDKFWGIFGFLGRTISLHFGTMSNLSIISAKKLLFRPNPNKYITNRIHTGQKNLGNSHHASVVGDKKEQKMQIESWFLKTMNFWLHLGKQPGNNVKVRRSQKEITCYRKPKSQQKTFPDSALEAYGRNENKVIWFLDFLTSS